MVAVPLFAEGKEAMFPSMKKRLHQPSAVAESAPTPITPASEDAEQKMTGSAMSIPAPVGIGPDGFPVLPSVSTMLGSASQTLEKVKSEASVLEARMVTIQQQNQEKMTHQKMVYEQRLKLQEANNKNIVNANAQITSNIQNLKKENNVLRKHAHELQSGNKLMRTEFKELQTKLTEAKDFVTESLAKTDDSKAPVLAVLQTPKVHHRHHLADEADEKQDDDEKSSGKDKDDDDDEQGSDDDEDDSAFVEVGAKRRTLRMDEEFDMAPAQPVQPVPEVDPRTLLGVLSAGVENLKKQEKASEEQLKTMFINSFKAGTVRHAALMQQQKGLNSTRTSLLQTQQQLRTAESHLQSTRSHLEQRLRGLGLFMQRLTKLALAPPTEVPKVLESVPSKVSVPTAK